MKTIKAVMQAYAKPAKVSAPKMTTKAAPAHVGHPHGNLGTYLHPKKGK